MSRLVCPTCSGVMEKESNLKRSMPSLRIMTQEDVCEFFGISKSTLGKWRTAGRFCREAKLPNGKVFFQTADVERWMKSQFSRF